MQQLRHQPGVDKHKYRKGELCLGVAYRKNYSGEIESNLVVHK
jgi:hypothetical protein